MLIIDFTNIIINVENTKYIYKKNTNSIICVDELEN